MTARTNLLITGGPGHPFQETSALVAGHLAEVGFHSTVVDDLDDAFGALDRESGAWDLVTVNALRWRMLDERYAPLREQWAFAIQPRHEQVLHDHVQGGGGLLALHAAVICFDPSRPWQELTGAAWDWERSSHPPLGEIEVAITEAGVRHPVTAGVGDFALVDEAYGFLDVLPGIEPLATTTHGGTDHPLLWARSIGAGHVVTDLLGHGPESVSHPTHGAILRAAAGWASRCDSTAMRSDHDG